MGEGAAVLVLEELNHALARNAAIYAELRGSSFTSDAFHITQPHPNGLGAKMSMQNALSFANLRPEDIDYVNAHATSTPLGDAIENEVIKSVFGKHSLNIAISSTKGAVGHLLGASGAIEAAFTVLSCHKAIVPPTINLHSLEGDFNLNYVPNQAQKMNVTAAACNSFGFGGTNACLIFSRYNG